LWLAVDNAPRTDMMPTAGDQTIYGGLYRSVELIVTEPSHLAIDHFASEGVYIQQTKVLPQEATVEATVRITAPADRLLSVHLAVLTPQGDTVATQQSEVRVDSLGRSAVTLPITMLNPTLWDGRNNPYRYTVSTQLRDEKGVCDEVKVPLGLRFFSVDPKQGFMLNGRPYPLHGVVYYEDRAAVGLALKPYHVQEDLDLITEMGANAVRAAGYPHNPLFYEECDRRGLIVWSEIPFLGPAYLSDRGYVNSEAFRQNGRNQLQEMIYQHYNHPSVVMWGLFVNQPVQGDDPTEYVKELNTLALTADPSRMTVAVSNQDGPINFVTDLVAWDHAYGWKEGQPSDLKVWMTQLQRNWGSLCSGISYGAGGSIVQQEDSLYRPDYLGNWHPERWQTTLHEQYFPLVSAAPFFWGCFVANMFDYGAAGRDWGEGTGVDDRGMVTFDRKYRKDAFYLYRANWDTLTPMVYIAERRWSPRAKRKQSLKVYSNTRGEVELLLNGASLGTKTGTLGVFRWEDVELLPGRNRIEVRSEAAADEAVIEIL
ncbi:MAG: glycoside hydrolase family 2 TIM barrel-domain containing protein, partial [Alistipes sp.]|nr:glycoside hydrolase family 2 TIM barrel-domain containing protein [Alistipes sp.]